MFEGMSVTIIPDAIPDARLTGTIRQLPSPYGTGDSDEGATRCDPRGGLTHVCHHE